MIAPETFRPEWLADLRRRHRGLDPSIVEKMIVALALVERLAQQDLPFVFKGGTCLVLLLGQLRRFSVDVDIVTTASPEAVAQAVAGVCRQPPFQRYEYDERRSTKDGIPRGHYYLYFDPIQDLQRAAPYVALDVLHEAHGYPALLTVPVGSDFVHVAGEPQLVTIPSVESITGDKLTAFAPTSTGIRYDQGKEQEIIKQLFDLGILFDEVAQVELVQAAYQATVGKELVYRNLPDSAPADVLTDTIRTALHLAHLKLNRRPGSPAETTAARELATGITAFAGFPFATRFGTDQAATSAAKAAYLAARLLVADYSALPRFPANPAPAITDQRFNYLNKLRSAPTALYYWQHLVALLAQHHQLAVLLPSTG